MIIGAHVAGDIVFIRIRRIDGRIEKRAAAADAGRVPSGGNLGEEKRSGVSEQK